MKNHLLTVGLLAAQILSNPLRAEEAPAATSSAPAKAVFQSLSDEQKAAAKVMAKQQVQEQAQAFQQLNPEQRQQKRAEFRAKINARRAAR